MVFPGVDNSAWSVLTKSPELLIVSFIIYCPSVILVFSACLIGRLSIWVFCNLLDEKEEILIWLIFVRGESLYGSTCGAKQEVLWQFWMKHQILLVFLFLVW